MIPLRVPVWCCALTLAALAGSARADETEATPASFRGRSYYVEQTVTYRTKPCYDPCEPVGPVRRFFRKLLLPRCPPPCPAPVVLAPVAPCPPPAPRSPAPFGAPLRPAVPPTMPPAEAPFPGASLTRPSRLTPPTPPPPVRLDRLASRGGREK